MKRPNPDPAAAYLRTFYQHNHRNFFLAVLLTVASTGTMLYFSWLLGEVTNLMASGDLAQLRRTAIVTAVAVGVGAILDLLMYSFKTKFVHQGLRQYKDYAFARLSEKRISAFAREHTSSYLSALTNDANSVEENYLNRSILLVFQCALFVGGLVMMLLLSWQLALATIVLSLLPVACSLGMGQELAAREKAASDQNERFVAQVKDFLSGFAVIKSFKAEAQTCALFHSVNAQTERAKARRRWWSAFLTVLSESCGSILQMGIFLFGAWLAIRGNIQMGTVLIILNLCNCFIGPIHTVPQYHASRQAARALIGKLAALTQENAAATGEPIPPQLTEAIALQDVSFGYEPDRPVLNHISLRFEAGKSYALVGASGSGKSTLLQLLMGSWPDYTGSITIDGRELRQVNPDSLYDLISLIDQNVFLFDDTLLQNITLFRDFPAEDIALAVERSGLGPLLAEKGADYRCGENGVELSGGERQRVSIARTLLRGTPVLMLDEATAALDNQTAWAVTDAILQLEGLTRLVITHRLEPGLLTRYDEIIVLRDGQVHEQGSFQTLMDRKGYFYSLYTVSR